MVISHAAADIGNGDMASMASRLNELMASRPSCAAASRSADFFEGLDLVARHLAPLRRERHGNRRRSPGTAVLADQAYGSGSGPRRTVHHG